MDFKKLLELLEKGENLASPFSGIIGKASGILNMLGLGRKKQMEQQKEMVENAAKINYKFGGLRVLDLSISFVCNTLVMRFLFRIPFYTFLL